MGSGMTPFKCPNVRPDPVFNMMNNPRRNLKSRKEIPQIPLDIEPDEYTQSNGTSDE